MPLIDPNYLRQAAMGRVNQGLLPAVSDDDYAAMLERLRKEREFNITRQERPGTPNMLETWPAGEEGTPDYARPEDLPIDKLGLEVNSSQVQPKDIVGDLASHDMAQNDPNMTGYYREFERSLTPEQHARLKEQYQWAQQNEGEQRPYEEWYQASGLPAYFRGGAFKQWDNPDQFYTPDQQQEQGRMLEYLKTGTPPGPTPSVAPPQQGEEPTMKSYDPSWREKLGSFIEGDDRNPGRRWLSEKLLGRGEEGFGAADLTPLGNVLELNRSYRKGDPEGMGLAVMPIPGASKGARLVKEGAKEAEKIAQPFFSRLREAVTEAPFEKASGKQWLGTIQNTPGVKPEEIEWTKFKEWADATPHATKEEALAHLDDNEIQVEEVLKQPQGEWTAENEERYRELSDLSNTNDITPYEEHELNNMLEARGQGAEMGSNLPKHGKWQLPGGKNYKELLLKFPRAKIDAEPLSVAELKEYHALSAKLYGPKHSRKLTPQEDARMTELRSREAAYNSQSKAADEGVRIGHYKDDPNTFAHVRFNERVIDGKRTLFIEEFQSDWHQKGRKHGYYDPKNTKKYTVDWVEDTGNGEGDYWGIFDPDGNIVEGMMSEHDALEAARQFGQGEHIAVPGAEGKVPDAPFKQSRDWGELSMKRMMKWASDNGFEQIAWTSGKTQAKRYSLSQAVDAVSWSPQMSGHGVIVKIKPKGEKKPFSLQIVDGKVVSRHNPSSMPITQFDGKHLDEIVGKDMAEKILGEEKGDLKGLDLDIGGKDMEEFYDKILVNATNKTAKKYGAKVGRSTLQTGRGNRLAELLDEHGYNPDEVTVQQILADHHGNRPRWLTDDELDDIDNGDHHVFEGTEQHDVWTLPVTGEMKEQGRKKGFPLFEAGSIPIGLLGANEAYKQGKQQDEEGLIGKDAVRQQASDRVNVGLLPAVSDKPEGYRPLTQREPFDPIKAYRGLPPKPGEPTMTTPPDPSIRQSLGRAIAGEDRQPGRQWLAEKLTGGTGLGEEGMGAMDLTPLGNVSDALESYGKGDYTGMGVAMIPGAPVARAGRHLLRRGAKEMQAEMRRIADMDLARDVEISRSRSNYPPEPKGPPGAAPDRSEFSLLRYNAPKGDSARFQALENKIDTDPSVANEIFSLAKDGEEIGRKWYDTEMLRDRFVKTLGEERGEDAWREFMWYVGATSTGSKVLPNIRNASHYFVEGQKKLRDLADDMIAGNYEVPESYGHKMQKNQMKNIGRIHAGEWGPNADQTLNPKPRGFFQSLLGNRSNIAADKHFMRLMGMMSDDPQFLHGSAEISKELVDELRGKYGKRLDRYIKFAPLKDAKGRPTSKVRINFNAKKAVKEGPKDLYAFIKDKSAVWDDMPNDNEYKAFERIAGKMAEKMNMTPAQFQASLWMGAAKKTKVDPSSLDTFVNLFNARLKKTAAERGLSEDEVWHRFATKKQALAIMGVPAGAAAAGSDDEEPLQPEMLTR